MSEHSKGSQIAFHPVENGTVSGAGLGRFILLGIFLFAAVAALGLLGEERLGEPIILIVLAVFASVGVFFLFSIALGIVKFGSHSISAGLADKLLGQMDAGIAVTDSENRVLFANFAYTSLIGEEDIANVSSPETLLSRRSETADMVYTMVSDVRVGKICVEEIRLQSALNSADKEAHWYRIHARQLVLDGGREKLTVWQLADVTQDRLEHESQFRELQDAIHYLDHAPAGFIASESDGRIAYINATLADWLGIDLALFRPSETNIRELIPSDNEALFNTANSRDDKSTTRLIDLDLKTAAGKRLPVRMYHRIAITADGAPGPSRSFVLNRSGELAGDAALLEAENRFTRFFNNTPVAIAGIDGSGHVIRTNAPFQEMFSHVIGTGSPGEGLALENLVKSEDREILQSAFDDALSGASGKTPIELQVEGLDEQFVRFFVSRVVDEDTRHSDQDEGSIERVIVYAVDTTEHRALEDQFTKGQKMQAVGQLAGGIAHDFNNVLTAIIGFSDLLLASHKPSDPSFQDIMNIKQNANRAASLVRQLLAFSRRQTLRPQVLQLADVISDLRMLLDRLVGDKIVLNVKHGRDLWPVKADISQLEQVLVNLVVNARDAMNDEGFLEIRTANIVEHECAEKFTFRELVAADYVLIEVEDDGIGMSEKILDQVFEPFFSTKEVGKGTGLGLSTVYGIVKQTGGFIYATSTEGKGTCFRVFLPRHIPEVQLEGEIPEEEKVEEPQKDLTGTATILLVEDEDAVRAFGSRALVGRGYEVHEAASGVEAIEVMDKYGDEIDLVVSDVVMPEMDGPTLLGEVRKSYPELKFIFVSGYAEEAFAKNMPPEERGQFGFLAKPFSLKQLASAVKEMLEE